MPAAIIIGLIAQVVDIVGKFALKHPETAPHLGPVVGGLIETASRAAEESPDVTAARLAKHDALVKAALGG